MDWDGKLDEVHPVTFIHSYLLCETLGWALRVPEYKSSPEQMHFGYKGRNLLKSLNLYNLCKQIPTLMTLIL